MTTTSRRLGALLSAGVLTVGLAACAADDEPADTATSAAESAATTQDDAATSSDDTATSDDAAAGEVEGEEIPVEEFLAMVKEPGEEMLSSYTMAMMLESQGQAIDAEGAVDLSGDQAAMHLTMTVPQVGELEMITVDGELFLSMPGTTPEGMYLQDTSDALGQADAMNDLDVTGQWDAWEEGAQQVLFLGEEDVDGTDMRHYQLTVDPAAAAAAMGEDPAAVTAAVGAESVVYDVWLDADNLMRRLTFDLEGTVAEMTMDNWGEPQEIEAPPADKVMDMGDLGGMGTEGSDG